MEGIMWKIARITAIFSLCSAARNYADYDHDYTNASDQETYIISSWLIAIIVSICLVLVIMIVLLVVCCLCCSTRRATPEQIAHTAESGTIYLTAITRQSQVFPENMNQVGCTNTAYTPNQESIITSETGPQIAAPPPPYRELPDIKTAEPVTE